MSIRYRLTVREYEEDGKIVKIYFPKIIADNDFSIEKMGELIESRSTLSTPDFVMALGELYEMLVEILLLGGTVDLGALGRFKLGLVTQACKNPEDVDLKSIKDVRINYKPSRKLIREIKDGMKLVRDRSVDEHGYAVLYSHSKKEVRQAKNKQAETNQAENTESQAETEKD
jgi:predicted histone-like DNA-binding protein